MPKSRLKKKKEKTCKEISYVKTICRFFSMVLVISWTLAASSALAQEPGALPLLENPQTPFELPGPPEKKEEAPSTCGSLITDTCIPIEEHQASLEVLGALNINRANFTPNWRQVSMHGDFFTFNMPVKFTYGPTRNLETYIVVPFIVDWCRSLAANMAGPNGETHATYAGIGDITTIAKYLVLEEGKVRPAVDLVGGVGWPSGHASHLNPSFLLQDAVGTGSFNFISGINLSKLVQPFALLKPFLLLSNIWLNSPINLYPIRSSDFPPNVRNRENVTFDLAAKYSLNKEWILLLKMYSTWAWSNPGTESLGFQSPTTVLGFQPGIGYIYSGKWSFSAGCAFDALGKFGSAKITPAVSVKYNF